MPWLAAVVLTLVLSAVPLNGQSHGEQSGTATPDHQAPDQTVVLFPHQDASGTAWVPEATPMYAVMKVWGGWQVMFHGNLVGQWLYEPGDRHRTGGFANEQWSSPNWAMALARRPSAGGRLGLRAMVSAEQWTVSDCGFLNYLATGEMCDGDTIHDRQHPHDLFMELGADYDRSLRGSLRWQVYGGLAGEPALGPPGFPHRLSAMPNPIAPISHHWLDSTHITFGLVTTGLYTARWKAEASVFNGREPDENRADIDLAAFDSFSGRLSFLPTPRIAVQVSAGHLHEAEAEFAPLPRSDVDKVTTSLMYQHELADSGFWATTLAYAINSGREFIGASGFDATTQALLMETNLTLRERHAWFGRAEVVQKPAHDLHAHEYTTRIFTVGKLEAGYARYWNPWNSVATGIGGVVSLNIVCLLYTSPSPRDRG